jgi:hypothetical protein
MLDEANRQRLVMMIPEVVGLNPDDERVAVALILSSARAANPVAAEERQNVMALAILNAEGVIAERDGHSHGQLSEASRKALSTAPAAERWARIHLARMGFNAAAVRPANAAKIVALAVDGVARACVDDTEDRLVRMVRDGIDVVKTFVPLEEEHVTVEAPWTRQDAPVVEDHAEVKRPARL